MSRLLLNFHRNIIYLLGMTACLLININVFADDYDDYQRGLFLQAYESLKSRDMDTFFHRSEQLRDYPLHYFLRYKYLRPRLKTVSSEELLTFLSQYGNSGLGEILRRSWLRQLAREKAWSTYLLAYEPQRSTVLQCHYLRAKIETGQYSSNLLDEIQEIWLVGKSQPNACDPAFAYFYNSGRVNDRLLWQRIKLSMEKNRLRLANAMANRLSTTAQQWMQRWEKMHHDPADTLATLAYQDTDIARDIIAHGIKRLAYRDFDQALAEWQNMQSRYQFSEQQIGAVQKSLAYASLRQQPTHAIRWLTAINKKFVDERLHEKRLYFALEKQNWYALANFIQELPEKERKTLRWQYWYGRALEETEAPYNAKEVFKKLAQERDYYGFLAADRISAPYTMTHNPITFTPTESAKLTNNINVIRAREFFKLGMHVNARRAWQYAIKHLKPREQAVAAALARRWQWYDRAIFTAAKAGAYDDLEVRFPMAYRDDLSQGADTQGLDLAWVYGIVRQESAFMKDVYSHAGAIGLMQLMPSTGRFVARKIGLKLNNSRDILDLNTNISLGTAYLRQMLDRFEGNYMLATAAYNAGPGRAKRWAEERACLPVDLWVEMIPFSETRTYVRRVLFYTAIFEARLGRIPTRLRLALPQIHNCQPADIYYVETEKTYQNNSVYR